MELNKEISPSEGVFGVVLSDHTQLNGHAIEVAAKVSMTGRGSMNELNKNN